EDIEDEPCFLKMPARCPSRGASTAHSPSCPIATLSVSCADAPEPATAMHPASRSDNSQRRLRMVALMVVSLRPPVPDAAFFLAPYFARGGIWMSSASCSLLSGASMNLSLTASL